MYGVALNGAGNAYVVGVTSSSQQTFPVAVGPDLTHNGNSDAFVAKVNANGKGLVYCGYIGGTGGEAAGDVAVDSTGNAYVSGNTASTEATFPVKRGPDLTVNGGNSDAFVAKIDATGSSLIYCGYIGGSRDERLDLTYTGGESLPVAVDRAGNAFVVGQTWSTESTFPVAVGPDLTYNGGGGTWGDAFVAKVALTLLQGSGAPRPGSAVTLTLTATDDVGLSHLMGSSLGTGPISIGKHKIGLSPDDLLVVSVNGYWPWVFSGYQGVIDSKGQAKASINIPNITALIGQQIHTAFVTLSPSAPSGIKSISNTFSFTITK